MLKNSEPAGFRQYACTPQRTFSQLGIEPNFNYQLFYFQISGNLVEENIEYKQLQKICREKAFCMNVFWAHLSKF